MCNNLVKKVPCPRGKGCKYRHFRIPKQQLEKVKALKCPYVIKDKKDPKEVNSVSIADANISNQNELDELPSPDPEIFSLDLCSSNKICLHFSVRGKYFYFSYKIHSFAGLVLI